MFTLWQFAVLCHNILCTCWRQVGSRGSSQARRYHLGTLKKFAEENIGYTLKIRNAPQLFCTLADKSLPSPSATSSTQYPPVNVHDMIITCFPQLQCILFSYSVQFVGYLQDIARKNRNSGCIPWPVWPEGRNVLYPILFHIKSISEISSFGKKRHWGFTSQTVWGHNLPLYFALCLSVTSYGIISLKRIGFNHITITWSTKRFLSFIITLLLLEPLENRSMHN